MSCVSSTLWRQANQKGTSLLIQTLVVSEGDVKIIWRLLIGLWRKPREKLEIHSYAS